MVGVGRQIHILRKGATHQPMKDNPQIWPLGGGEFDYVGWPMAAAAIFVGVAVLAFLMYRLKAHHASEDDRPREYPEVKNWDGLCSVAEETVGEIQARMSDLVREKAESIPVVFEKWPKPPDEAQALGLFEGFEEDVEAESKGPIILFVGAIDQHCREEGLDFADEVGITYLHELGHYFGWDEDALAARGLD